MVEGGQCRMLIAATRVGLVRMRLPGTPKTSFYLHGDS